ncbi:hypothetical protein BH20ACI4_BH20ACI4_05460 [soil metagenome]
MSNFNDQDEEFWELSPENSHPNTVAILTDEFYWNEGDDNSPFGNDTGNDTLKHFQKWREKNWMETPIAFLDQLLDDWEVTNDFWDVTDASEAEKLCEQDEFSFNVRDEVIIALAFGQLLLAGKVDAEPKRRALLAIERQSLPTIVKFFWEDFTEEQIERLRKMKIILEKL